MLKTLLIVLVLRLFETSLLAVLFKLKIELFHQKITKLSEQQIQFWVCTKQTWASSIESILSIFCAFPTKSEGRQIMRNAVQICTDTFGSKDWTTFCQSFHFGIRFTQYFHLLMSIKKKTKYWPSIHSASKTKTLLNSHILV